MEFECRYCKLRWNTESNQWNEPNGMKLIGLICAEQCPIMVNGIKHYAVGVIN